MTPIRIFFQDNEILIDTIVMPIVAGSLTAAMSADGSSIDICRVQSSFVLLSPPWGAVADVNGSTFANEASALAYVQGQLAMRRPVGTVITPYPITATSTFTVDHGLTYAPRTTVVDQAGAEVTTDVVHAPGQTTLTFAAPFTGTLYLG